MAEESQELYLYKVTINGVETQLKLTRKLARQLYGDAAQEVGPAKSHEPTSDTPLNPDGSQIVSSTVVKEDDTPTDTTEPADTPDTGAKKGTAKDKAAAPPATK